LILGYLALFQSYIEQLSIRKLYLTPAILTIFSSSRSTNRLVRRYKRTYLDYGVVLTRFPSAYNDYLTTIIQKTPPIVSLTNKNGESVKAIVSGALAIKVNEIVEQVSLAS